MADMPSSVLSSPVTVETTTNGPRRIEREQQQTATSMRRARIGAAVRSCGSAHDQGLAAALQEGLERLHHQRMVLRLRQAGHRDRADDADVAHDDREAPAVRGIQDRLDAGRLVERSLPRSASRRPTRYDESPNLLTTLIFRSIQVSLSGVVPASAAWNSWCPCRRMSTVRTSPRACATDTSSDPSSQASSLVNRLNCSRPAVLTVARSAPRARRPGSRDLLDVGAVGPPPGWRTVRRLTGGRADHSARFH